MQAYTWHSFRAIALCKGSAMLTRGAFQPTGTLILSLPAAGGEARSVEGQVQQLLHDAQDPEKLSRMYVGWASWV